MAASGFGHLGLDERRPLFWLQEAHVPVAQIAAHLGWYRSTIYRELARNCFRNPDTTWDRRRDMPGCYPKAAQHQALTRRLRLAERLLSARRIEATRKQFQTVSVCNGRRALG